MTASLAGEDGFRDERRHDVVRHVDHVADAQIHGHAAENIRLLAGPAPLLEQVDHVEDRVAAGEVRFSPSFTPSSRIGMPMAATKPFGVAHSGAVKYPACEKRGPRRARVAAVFFSTRKRTTAVAPISTAVTQTSPSPWAKWPSPVEKSAPSTATGSSSFEPFVSCFTSKLPPFSRGGSVRSPSV